SMGSHFITGWELCLCRPPTPENHHVGFFSQPGLSARTVWPDDESGQPAVHALAHLAAAAPSRRQTVCSAVNGRADVVAESVHRTDDAEGDDDQQQRILRSRRPHPLPSPMYELRST